MVCARAQKTLAPAECDLTHFAQSLGWLRLAVWHALEKSTSVPAPLSTGLGLTQQMVRLLVDAGLIQTDDSSGKAGIRRALYEPLQWTYCHDFGDLRRLPTILNTALTAPSIRRAAWAQRELWEALADAEIETYLAHLLRRHALDPVHATVIAEAMREEWAEHNLARRRYLAWCGIRGAATTLLRTNFDQDAAQRVMLEEMRRRCRWLLAKASAGELPPADYCFVPEAHWKRPLLLEVLVTTALPDASTYWTAVPERFLRTASPAG